jgi:thiosulfate/3-mercaptopyruvate sulfurtransferase
MQPLIAAAELQSLLTDPHLRLFDCRYALMDAEHGRRSYAQSHLPGARFVDMNSDLSAQHIKGKTSRHPLPPRATWLATVCRLGITPNNLVVLYDDGGGSSSARMWWMLQWLGHANVRVLDGGWQAWQAAGLATTAEVPVPYAAAADHYSALAPRMQLLLAEQVDGTQQLLLDARDRPRFRGEVEPIDPVAGHIPGAQCSPFADNLLEPNGCFKSAAELRQKFAVAASSSKPVVCYCGSGITACHNILAMAVAGLPMPALYAGSWSEWITDAKRPVAVGD